MLVLHYTGMRSAALALDRLRDHAARVSAHYLVDEDGAVVQLVPEAERAWHAGVSQWQGRSGLNDVSLGVELVNPGHEWGYRPFPAAQMAALAALGRELVRRWSIPLGRIVGHSDVAPDRKQDPGELFDWRGLAAAGLGRWPEGGTPAPPEVGEAAALLAAIGYPAMPLEVVLAAFQRRYRQGRVDGRLDAETMGRLRVVAQAAS